MARSADYVLPGHHEPIGTWPTEQLVNLYEDLRFDLDAGFAAPETKSAMAAVAEELSRREKGGEAEPQNVGGAVSRALERWLPEEASALPFIRGQAQEGAAVLSTPTEVETRVQHAQTPELEPAAEPEPGRRPILSLVWEKAETVPAVERDEGPEPE